GTLRQSGRPTEKLIAEKTVGLLTASGSIENGFSFQAGSGAISLLVSRMLSSYMEQNGITALFASGGITGGLVDILESGLVKELLDVQSFDDQASRSLGSNPRHKEISASQYAGPSMEDCVAHRLDIMVLSGTEIDEDFNLNSLTGTNGRILGALGGGPDTAEGANLTVAVMPTMRGRIPTINTRVNTVCTPGEFVDAVVTERGICINPRRTDLEKRLRNAGITTRSITDLRAEVHQITGVPAYPEKNGRVVGIVETRRGDKLDTISLIE
ncbi:MAG: citrate lyase subunit alpha, partial [Spirochaetaceae bacterium]|nr:citrate lyase subunit alpha [Spirochaetaceae bacterium]